MDEKDIPIEIRLRQFRKMHALSQEELADELGISRQSVISLEQGKTMPSLPLAVSLCRFFDTAFEDIFDFQREVEAEIEKALEADDVHPIKIINIKSGPVTSGPRKENAMVPLEPWKPFREAVSLRDAMDRLFEDSVITPTKIAGAMPRIDVKEVKGKVVVKAELPGVNEEDISVEILDNVMTISGEKKEEKEESDEKSGYFYKESHSGSFTRSFSLPGEVVTEKAVADMKNGILTITVPKVEPKQAKKISIGAKK
jgi:HSP20 family protein